MAEVGPATNGNGTDNGTEKKKALPPWLSKVWNFL
jgi:hypothetical protein